MVAIFRSYDLSPSASNALTSIADAVGAAHDAAILRSAALTLYFPRALSYSISFFSLYLPTFPRTCFA
eukprot:6149020-Pleurochrysis_carterae.AAC.4